MNQEPLLTDGDFEDPAPVVVTHVGKHHADELLACAMLYLLYGDSMRVVRTHDERLIEHADLTVDVGRIYAPGAGRFDHHGVHGMPVADPRRRPEGYASAGLVWKAYGAAVVNGILDDFSGRAGMVCGAMPADERKALVAGLIEKLDDELVAPVDRWDLGYHYTGGGRLVPLQWLLPYLEFEQALVAMARAMSSRIAALAMEEIGARILHEDLVAGNGVEFYQFGETSVILCRNSGDDGPRLEWRAASAMAARNLEFPLAAMIVPLRKGSRWAALLGGRFPERDRIPYRVQISGNRRTIFSDNPDILLDTLKKSMESGGWVLTAVYKEGMVPPCQGSNESEN